MKKWQIKYCVVAGMAAIMCTPVAFADVERTPAWVYRADNISSGLQTFLGALCVVAMLFILFRAGQLILLRKDKEIIARKRRSLIKGFLALVIVFLGFVATFFANQFFTLAIESSPDFPAATTHSQSNGNLPDFTNNVGL